MKYYLKLIKHKQWADFLLATGIGVLGIYMIYYAVLYLFQQMLGINPFGIIATDLSEVMDTTQFFWLLVIGILVTYYGFRSIPTGNVEIWDMSEVQFDIVEETLHIGYQNHYWESDRKKFVDQGLPRRDKNDRKVSRKEISRLRYLVSKRIEMQEISLQYPMGTSVVKPECFVGKRRAQKEEGEYLKILLLKSLDGAGKKAFQLVILFLQ